MLFSKFLDVSQQSFSCNRKSFSTSDQTAKVLVLECFILYGNFCRPGHSFVYFNEYHCHLNISHEWLVTALLESIDYSNKTKSEKCCVEPACVFRGVCCVCVGVYVCVCVSVCVCLYVFVSMYVCVFVYM